MSFYYIDTSKLIKRIRDRNFTAGVSQRHILTFVDSRKNPQKTLLQAIDQKNTRFCTVLITSLYLGQPIHTPQVTHPSSTMALVAQHPLEDQHSRLPCSNRLCSRPSLPRAPSLTESYMSTLVDSMDSNACSAPFEYAQPGIPSVRSADIPGPCASCPRVPREKRGGGAQRRCRAACVGVFGAAAVATAPHTKRVEETLLSLPCVLF